MKVYLNTTKGIDKESSEDRVLVGEKIFIETDDTVCFSQGSALIADGVGGNAGGAVAAYTVCKELSTGNHPSIEELIRINRVILDKASSRDGLYNMATTASGLFWDEQKNITAYHIGNTRIYAIQASQYLKQLTEDDTVVEFLLKTGKITEEEAESYYARNEITACFGGGKESLFRIKVFPLMEQYQYFLLTCDGIHEYLNIDEMEDIIAEGNEDWKAIVDNLVTAAKKNGSPDDCSAVIIDCMEEDENGAEV